MPPPKTNKKVLILEAMAGGGHYSISQAIIQALKPYQLNIETANVSPKIYDLYYAWTGRYCPPLWAIFWHAINGRRRSQAIAMLNYAIQGSRIKRLILEPKPDLILIDSQQSIKEIAHILSQHHLNIPFLVFVPDPYTINAVCFSTQATHTLVSTPEARQKAIDYGLDPSKITITGHPIRPQFFHPPPDIKQHRQKLKLAPDKFTILMGGSGNGAETTFQILKHFIQITNHQPVPDCQVLLVTGRSRLLERQLHNLNFPDHITPHFFGHTNQMSELVHASDLVMAKAGPNIILESAAAGKPFIATFHITGQENDNLKWVTEQKLGYVEENPRKAAQLLKRIIENPSLLDFTKPGLMQLKNQHQPAAQNIANQVMKFLN